MEFSSLGKAYRYAVEIEKKFQQKNKQDFGPTMLLEKMHGKGNPTSHNKGQHRDNQTLYNMSKKGVIT